MQRDKQSQGELETLQLEFAQLLEIVEGAAARVMEEQDRTEEVLSALGQALFGLDIAGCVQFLNPACEEMMGWTAMELQGVPLHDLIHAAGPGNTACTDATCPLLYVLTHSAPRRVEHDKFRRKDGSSVPVAYVCSPIHRGGVQIGALICFDDITERIAAAQALDEYARQVKAQNEQLFTYCEELTVTQRRLEQQTEELTMKNAQILQTNLFLKDLATTDGMTGLKNHRAFQEALRGAWASGLEGGRPRSVSLMLVDVDFFKACNDTFGHPAGDEVLKELAAILRESMRPSDLIARYGGEEFVVVAWDLGMNSALRAARRLCRKVERYPFANRTITVSIGVGSHEAGSDARFGGLFDTPDDLIRAADEALYIAKGSGRNRVCGAAGLSRAA